MRLVRAVIFVLQGLTVLALGVVLNSHPDSPATWGLFSAGIIIFIMMFALFLGTFKFSNGEN